MGIAENYQKLREEIPGHITIVTAAKTRTVEEVKEVINAGATDIGENYVQEGQAMYAQLGELAEQVTWHMIGHLQTNKINKALPVFDVIQSVDSLRRAKHIDKRVERAGKQIVPVYLEINIGNEDSKDGILPEDHDDFEEFMEDLSEKISQLEHLRLEGLMTMGPRFGDPENARPYFKRVKKLFDRMKGLGLPNVDMKTLSMGMTNSYKVAIEEGSTMVRIGSAVFGKRE